MTDSNGVLQAVFDADLRALRISGSGAVSGAPDDATYVTLSTNSTLSSETLFSSLMLAPDVVANRPSPGTAGRYFPATDTGLLYRDNGSSWDVVSSQTPNDATRSFAIAMAVAL